MAGFDHSENAFELAAAVRGSIPVPLLPGILRYELVHISSFRSCQDHNLCWAFSISPARSPMMTQGAIVLPDVTRGRIDPSAIRRLSIP